MKDITRSSQDARFGNGIKDAGSNGGKLADPCLPGADNHALTVTHSKSGKLSGNTLPGANDTRLYAGKGAK